MEKLYKFNGMINTEWMKQADFVKNLKGFEFKHYDLHDGDGIQYLIKVIDANIIEVKSEVQMTWAGGTRTDIDIDGFEIFIEKYNNRIKTKNI